MIDLTWQLARLDDSCKRALTMAIDEARSLGHNYVGPEHLWLALFRASDGTARILETLSMDLGLARDEVTRVVGRGAHAGGRLTLTPRTKKAIEMAVEEADHRGQPVARPEHLLLGLVREAEQDGSVVDLHSPFKLTLREVRERTLKEMASGHS